MRRSNFPIVQFLLVSILVLNGCGAQDYGPDSSATPGVMPPLGTSEPTPSSPIPVVPRAILEHDVEDDGYFWKGMNWIGMKNGMVDKFKTELADNSRTDAFCAFGATLLSGALLGLVMRTRGSWFFGGPVEDQSAHWFWRGLKKTVKSSTRGATRGGMFTGACYLLLAGLRPLPFEGILGANYRGLSSSFVIAAVAAATAAPVINNLTNADWGNPQSKFGKFIAKQKLVGQAGEKLEDWSAKSELTRGMRYKVAPRILLVGIAAGVGVMVYDACRD